MRLHYCLLGVTANAFYVTFAVAFLGLFATRLFACGTFLTELAQFNVAASLLLAQGLALAHQTVCQVEVLCVILQVLWRDKNLWPVIHQEDLVFLVVKQNGVVLSVHFNNAAGAVVNVLYLVALLASVIKNVYVVNVFLKKVLRLLSAVKHKYFWEINCNRRQPCSCCSIFVIRKVVTSLVLVVNNDAFYHTLLHYHSVFGLSGLYIYLFMQHIY